MEALTGKRFISEPASAIMMNISPITRAQIEKVIVALA
jgi:hypothetical protein